MRYILGFGLAPPFRLYTFPALCFRKPCTMRISRAAMPSTCPASSAAAWYPPRAHTGQPLRLIGIACIHTVKRAIYTLALRVSHAGYYRAAVRRFVVDVILSMCGGFCPVGGGRCPRCCVPWHGYSIPRWTTFVNHGWVFLLLYVLMPPIIYSYVCFYVLDMIKWP